MKIIIEKEYSEPIEIAPDHSSREAREHRRDILEGRILLSNEEREEYIDNWSRNGWFCYFLTDAKAQILDEHFSPSWHVFHENPQIFSKTPWCLEPLEYEFMFTIDTREPVK